MSRLCAFSRSTQVLRLALGNVNRSLIQNRPFTNLICNSRQSLRANVIKAMQRGSGTATLRLASDSSQKGQKSVGYWLLTCSGMVFVAVVLGIGLYFGVLQSVYKVVEEIVKSAKGS